MFFTRTPPLPPHRCAKNIFSSAYHRHLSYNILPNMNPNSSTIHINHQNNIRVRKCGACGGSGHDRRNCPSSQNTTAVIPSLLGHSDTTAVEIPQLPPLLNIQPFARPYEINMERVLYFVFDLETTGFVNKRDEIIEIGGLLLGPDRTFIEDAKFEAQIKPKRPLSDSISSLTGITNEELNKKPSFSVVGRELVNFIEYVRDSYYEDGSAQSTDYIILVAHNGKRFDIPFLLTEFRKYNIEIPEYLATYGLDTMLLASQVLPAAGGDLPINYSLSSVYNFITGQNIQNAHRALSDAKAAATIVQFNQLWQERKDSIFKISHSAIALESDNNNNNYDSDDDDEEDENDINSEPEEININEDDEDEETDIEYDERGCRWERNRIFDPSGPSENNFFPDSTRVGLKYSPSNFNTPIRAWRQIFTNYLLNMIVNYTNDYGGLHCKDWVPIDQNDLLDFFSVLFLMSIQKRKDKPSNWFSSDPILECPQAKKIMSGKKFSRMLRYIHCCSVEPPAGDYDPVYKVKEVMDYVIKRSNKLFNPGECLSLDETLIRSFGRIKFRVRIISKSARYGIKIYVVTDAKTSYVLKVIVYTGRSNNVTEDDGTKKTVTVVKTLLEDFKGTNRHVFVDRFYTSLELLRVLDTYGIRMTGTVMANRLPKGVRIAKSSPEFKAMARGDSISYRLIYKNASDQDATAGLVVWKDSTMVYCLSNGCNNISMNSCNRRSANGTIVIPRPSCISKYNENMGGVDLADMRRLHCNSTIMGQKRWWLKLFFIC